MQVSPGGSDLVFMLTSGTWHPCPCPRQEHSEWCSLAQAR